MQPAGPPRRSPSTQNRRRREFQREAPLKLPVRVIWAEVTLVATNKAGERVPHVQDVNGEEITPVHFLREPVAGCALVLDIMDEHVVIPVHS